MSRQGTIAALLLCAILAACGEGSGTGGGRGHLQGTITARQKLGLPPGATVSIALIETGGTDSKARTITESRLRDVDGAPIEFMLTYPQSAIGKRGDYTLRAEIADAKGTVRWATRRPVPVSPLAEEGSVDVVVVPAGPPEGRRVHYVCDGFAADVTAGEKSAVIQWHGQRLELPSVASASGAKYADDDAVFWSKDQVEAVIEAGGTTHRGCAVTSRLTGIGPHLRAGGSDPFWLLRLRGDRDDRKAQFIAGSGEQSRVSSFSNVQLAEPANGKRGQRVYGASNGSASLAATVAEEPCRDGDSGQSLPLTVTVQIKDQLYRGCGERIDRD